jgi:SAM-dependent methyltransferase
LLDYSTTQLQQAQSRLGNSERYIYVAADAYQLPFLQGVFDGASMIRTLHHMAEPQKALEQVRQVLQPGASFILEYANKQNLKAILRYMLQMQSWSPFTFEAVEFTTLNFDFHPKSIRSWLGTTGFDVERQLTVSHFRINLLKRLFPLDLLVKLDSLAQLTGDWWQLSPSVFVLSQAAGETPTAPPGALFRCLECGHAELEQLDNSLRCSSCDHHWGYENGIYDFRLK